MKHFKRASIDFDKSRLPSNRFEVFTDVIKNRWKTLLALGMIIFIFSIPLISVQWIAEIIIQQLTKAYTAGKTEQIIYSLQIKRLYSVSGLINILCYMIAAIGIAGNMRVIKRLIWGEGINTVQDFFQGVKENYSKTVWLAVICGAVMLSTRILPLILNENKLSDTEISLFLAFIDGITVIILFPLGMFTLSQIAFYKNKLPAMFKNSLYFYGKYFLMSLLWILLLLLPMKFVKGFIPADFSVLYYAAVCIIIIPLFLMIWLLFSCYVFDNTVNPKFYPEIVNKGIQSKVS